ncbi:N2,N2-dimethylguanosine tRNA methyltransferase [Astrocystis sublimbata]|nr:N2,N2-dimethylguanosine tRNA methyltransferase [Astrocystis sublimbata]
MATTTTKTTAPPNGSASNGDIQTFVRDGQEFTQVKEGLGRILVPFSKPDPAAKATTKSITKSVEEQQSVFYNPIQQFNRDLTVLAIKAYADSLLSKPRPANAKHVAKRKRDKSDAAGPHPKRPAGPETTSDSRSDAVDTSSVTAESSEVPGKEEAAPRPQDADATQPDAPEALKAPPAPHFTILDALSATGLRALRYAQELPFVTSVTANDLTPSAVDAIRRNAEHNGVESKVIATQGDARAHMYHIVADEATRDHDRTKFGKKSKIKSNRYNVIDLDPYGTAAPFLDAAVNAVRDDGGLLCVTCTDSGVWASNGYPEKAYSLYGGIPIKGSYSHEVGLRLVLHALAKSAAINGLAIKPLLSLSIDYYLRIFVKIQKSPAQVKFLAGKTMNVYNCDNGCGAWNIQLLARNKKVLNKSGNGAYYKHGLAMASTPGPNCSHCDSKMHLAGPMYAGPLHSPEFIKKILHDLPSAPSEIYGTKPRIEGMLYTALEESITPPHDPDNTLPACREDEFAAIEPYPFYFHPTNLAGAMHCVCPDEDSFRGALRSLGYEVTRSHCKGGSLKTNASWSVIWHVMREWTRQKFPVKTENIKENSPAYKLLRLGDANKPQDEIDKLEVVFDKHLGRDRSKQGLIRYQSNPDNWGPQSRAKGH